MIERLEALRERPAGAEGGGREDGPYRLDDFEDDLRLLESSLAASGFAEAARHGRLRRLPSRGATLLVVTETWDPGWRARLGGPDGEPAPVEAVDGVLLGVRVAPRLGSGSGTLALTYRPRGIAWGRR